MTTTANTELRCAVLDDYQDSALRRPSWDRLRGRVEVHAFHAHVDDEETLANALADFDILVLMRERTPVTRALLQRLPRLKLLVTTGIRNGVVDVDACRDFGIPVCGTRGVLNDAAELTWALILASRRHLLREAASLRAGGPWQQTEGRSLKGSMLGVIGLGRLGSAVARVGLAFGMDVQAWSRNLTAERCHAVGVRHCQDLDTLLSTSDVVTIHSVLSDRTRGLVDAAALACMRSDALLVNNSRGPIVDEAALVAALASNAIGGAALDVYEQEPLPADHPFRTLPNVLATPHIGYVTVQNYDVFFADIVEDIEGWLAGTLVREIVQPHPAQRSAARPGNPVGPG